MPLRQRQKIQKVLRSVKPTGFRLNERRADRRRPNGHTFRYSAVLAVFRRVIGHTFRYLLSNSTNPHHFRQITNPLSATTHLFGFFPQITDPLSARATRHAQPYLICTHAAKKTTQKRDKSVRCVRRIYPCYADMPSMIRFGARFAAAACCFLPSRANARSKREFRG